MWRKTSLSKHFISTDVRAIGLIIRPVIQAAARGFLFYFFFFFFFFFSRRFYPKRLTNKKKLLKL